MKTIECDCYYNKDYGYIFTSFGVDKETWMKRVIEPIIKEKSNSSSEKVRECTLRAIQNTANAPEIEDPNFKGVEFWKTNNIKGFSSFSKKFQCISITKNNDIYELEKLSRDKSGAYGDPEDGIIFKCSSEELGEKIIEIFQDEPVIEPEKEELSFETLNGSAVIYKTPSDDLTDIGDGHTDAYQIYTYGEDIKNYIAFLIDNGYSDFKKKPIKKRWKQMYPTLSNFEFAEVNSGTLKIKVQGTSDNAVIHSYIYKDGDSFLEVMTEVSTDITKHEQQAIAQEFEDIVQSIEIK